ncbi:MAG: anthranilate phosphoribosyltransferase [Oscillospiraceae bacterium]|nr:anthranilate phosphoribosyltransferase [Oscillospiraceae bacterium]
MMKEAIAKLMNKQDLTYEEARQVMDEIMDGKVSATLISSYLTALSMKGETIDEISGSAYAMRAHATKAPHDMDVLEIVGTGGDGANTFNISSTSAMVIAAGGVPVAKHGNRAASSKSGAADVLEALGVNISLPPEKCRALLEQVGICFLFAQTYHTAMKYVGPVRKELGIRTVFNILGPITNPAAPTMGVMGVYDQSLLEPYAAVMQNLGIRRGLVVYGTDRLDEISASAPTAVCEIRDGKTNLYEITPEQFGYTRCQKSDLLGGTPEENAQITRNILSGQDKGPKRQAVCLNAGAALYAAGSAETMEAGVRLAEYLIDSGRAMEKLQQFVEASNQ